MARHRQIVRLVPSELSPRRQSRPTVDEWGRDERLIEVLAPLAKARWDITVGGAQHLRDGPALVVTNTRRFAFTPVSSAWALSKELDRPVRFVGRPDIVPFGPFLRRVGGLLAHPNEVAGALRAGQVVVLGAASTNDARLAGRIDPSLIEPAIREGAAVHVAATIGSSMSRQLRVEVASAVGSRLKRRGPLAEIELADQAQRRLQDLLDELDSTRPGLPGFGWLGALR